MFKPNLEDCCHHCPKCDGCGNFFDDEEHFTKIMLSIHTYWNLCHRCLAPFLLECEKLTLKIKTSNPDFFNGDS